MPRRVAPDDVMYLDEAEGFLLEHALIDRPRTWPPLPDGPSQSTRLTAHKRKMDWEGEVRAHPDEPIVLPMPSKKEAEEDANKERCVICLMALRDRTIVGVCGHEFCFECIGVWANQSRRCPLCSSDMAPFLLHDLDNTTPTKFYLPPLPQRKLPSMSLSSEPSRRPILPEQRAGAAEEKAELDELDMQVDRRREVYELELYVKHVASNSTTKFRPNPTPRQIADDPQLTQRATAFMRRELRVWSLVDVEFLTTYILSLLKAIDIRSEPAVRLLAEFLDTSDGPGYPHGAEHFAHELYSFLRSPYKELWRYDEVAQYDPIVKTRSTSPSPLQFPRPRSHPRSPSRSLSPLPRSLSPPSRSRSSSRSPLSPRDIHRRDTFIPPRSPGERLWYEADHWVDPDHAAWLEEEKRRDQERRDRRRGKHMRVSQEDTRSVGMRAWGPLKGKVELLPSPPPAPLRMDEDVKVDGEAAQKALALTIRGAAVSAPARKTLLERLAIAKAEAAANGQPAQPNNGQAEMDLIAPVDEVSVQPPVSLGLDSHPLQSPGVRAAVQARLRLRLKLASEKKTFVYNQNESRAQALRAMILEAKTRRQATETDSVLRHMDRLDRAKEIRRRMMAEKMMAAETESERRARELKEKLMGEKRARVLREMLKERKKSHGEVGCMPAVSVH